MINTKEKNLTKKLKTENFYKNLQIMAALKGNNLLKMINYNDVYCQ